VPIPHPRRIVDFEDLASYSSLTDLARCSITSSCRRTKLRRGWRMEDFAPRCERQIDPAWKHVYWGVFKSWIRVRPPQPDPQAWDCWCPRQSTLGDCQIRGVYTEVRNRTRTRRSHSPRRWQSSRRSAKRPMVSSARRTQALTAMVIR